MVKPSKPESQDSKEPQEVNFDTAHPLMRSHSQAQDAIERSLKRKDAVDFKITELEEWKRTVNAIAATDNGKLLFKSMLDYSGMLMAPDITNANKMVTNTLKGAFYFTWIRPYLETQVRKELE